MKSSIPGDRLVNDLKLNGVPELFHFRHYHKRRERPTASQHARKMRMILLVEDLQQRGSKYAHPRRIAIDGQVR
jgi:hypothetical protein